MDNLLTTLALAYQYPTPGSTKAIWERVNALPKTRAKDQLERFLKTFSELKLSEREELYTRTLDLTPLTAPNIGYAVYGEDYRRGRFMSELNAEYARLEVDGSNEIPDHLVPVLRYLAVAEQPLPELLQLLEPALKQIIHTLQVLEPRNPYLMLLEATLEALKPYIKQAVVGLSARVELPVALGSLFNNLPFMKGGRE